MSSLRTRNQEELFTQTQNKLSTLSSTFSKKYSNHPDLVKDAQDLIKYCSDLASVFHEYDMLPETPANGYRTLVKKFTMFLQHVCCLENPDDTTVNKITTIISRVRSNLHLVDTMRSNEKILGLSYHEDKWDNLLDMHLSLCDEQLIRRRIVFDPLIQFFGLDKMATFIVSFVYCLLAFLTTDSWAESIKSLVSEHFRMEVVRKYFSSCDFGKALKLTQLSTGFIMCKLNPFLAYGSWMRPWKPFPSVNKKINVPSQKKWVINCDVDKKTVDLVRGCDTDNETQGKPITCHILRENPTDNHSVHKSFKNKVLVYAHGGAFHAGSTGTTMAFMPSFCRKMPGLTILSIDYSLAPENKFPTPVQEALDVVLWLQSNDQSVKEALGFTPESFVFSGDSAGAHIMMTVLLLMNDINRTSNSRDEKLVLPQRFVGFFPAFNISVNLNASLLMSFIDIILPFTMLLNAILCYLPLKQGIDRKLNPEIGVHSLKSKQEIKEAFKEYEFLFNHPYISHEKYQHFGDLSSVELNVFIGEDDPMLDNGTLLLHVWRGKKTLDVGIDLKHGYTYFMPHARTVFRGDIEKEITRQEDIFVNRMKDSHGDKIDENENPYLK